MQWNTTQPENKSEIMPFAATWVDLEMIILSGISYRKANTIWYHLYVESKYDTDKLFMKQAHRHGKQTYGYLREKGMGER